MAFGDILKELRTEKHLTQSQLAKCFEISASTIGMYEQNRREPDFETLEAIADFFNVDMDYLTGRSTVKNKYRELNKIPEGFSPPPEMVLKPLVGKIACGTPILAEQNIDGYILLPNGISADYALNCDGDSMVDAGIYDGDVVFIKEQPMVENGEIAAILIDGETTLKKVYKDKDKLSLIPANSKYAPLTFVKNEINMVSILGKATAYLHKIE